MLIPYLCSSKYGARSDILPSREYFSGLAGYLFLTEWNSFRSGTAFVSFLMLGFLQIGHEM